jgi:hypothetical protein
VTQKKKCGVACGTHTFDPETPDVSKIASIAWLKVVNASQKQLVLR